MRRVRFNGFGEHAVEFFDGLDVDNSRAYWEDNREIYAGDVRAPMEALVAELEGEFAGKFGGSGRPGTGKVFRPHRDLRFSKDKRPYKLHCGGVIEPGRGAGAYYVELSSAGLRVGGGSFRMAPDQLARYRVAVDEERRGTELAKLLDELCAAGWQLCGDRMRTGPRGYPAEHPRMELLRHRTVYLTYTWPPDAELHTRSALERVRAAWRQLTGLNEWIYDHVGLVSE